MSTRSLRTIILGITLTLLVPTTTGAAESGQSVVVEPGDTLSHIALRTGVPVGALAEANGITDPNSVRSGMTLVIPSFDRGEPVTDYVVVSGDTLSEIAVRAGTTTKHLVELNGLDDRHLIRVGQRLTVPVHTGVATASTSHYPKLPERIVNRPERAALIPVFERWAEANQISAELLMSLSWQESGWNNEAVSHKGAVGIGQLMPATSEWIATNLIGVPSLDPTVPEDNIRMSARFLRWLIDRTGSEEDALAGYYQGLGSISRNDWFDSTHLYVDAIEFHRQYFAKS